MFCFYYLKECLCFWVESFGFYIYVYDLINSNFEYRIINNINN